MKCNPKELVFLLFQNLGFDYFFLGCKPFFSHKKLIISVFLFLLLRKRIFQGYPNRALLLGSGLNADLGTEGNLHKVLFVKAQAIPYIIARTFKS